MKPKDYLKMIYRWMFRRQVSYSQTGEDLIAGFFLSEIKKGFYVDIGANDPVYLNNTYWFYKKGWRGVCVEPNVFRCQILRQVRSGDKVVNAGASGAAGELDFYIFDMDQISTFSASEAEEFKKLGHRVVETKKVATLTLEQILQQYAGSKPVDMLSLDTEGLDLEILNSNDWTKFRPKLVIVETAEYRKDSAVRTHRGFDEFFLARGYIKLADTFINGLYMEGFYARQKKLENILS